MARKILTNVYHVVEDSFAFDGVSVGCWDWPAYMMEARTANIVKPWALEIRKKLLIIKYKLKNALKEYVYGYDIEKQIKF